MSFASLARLHPMLVLATGLGACIPAHAQTTAPNGRDDVPRQRQLPAFIYDERGDRLLLFGGLLASTLDIDHRTFAWREGVWSVVAEEGPLSRDDMAFVYDQATGSTLLFGGRGSSSVDSTGRPVPMAFNDTWRFDGQRWSRVDTAGPGGRSHVRAALDPTRNRVVLFGGAIGHRANGPLATDTWEWDGARWTRMEVPGPPGRTGHVMEFDPVSKLVIMHGGLANSAMLTDTWGWNGQTWRLLSSDGPGSVFGASARGPNGGVLLFGGNQRVNQDTWLWNGTSWSIVASGGPPPRMFHAMATDTRRHRTYLIGGWAVQRQDGFAYSDLWYIDKNMQWVQVYPHTN